MNPRDKRWSKAERDLLERSFRQGGITNREIAQVLGRSVYSVNTMASKLGLRRVCHGVRWTDAKLSTLRMLFPCMFNQDLAKMLGVSQRTMIRKARELGLEKSPNFRADHKYDINRRASEALKEKYKNGTCISHFKKGEHACPEYEFAIGHIESRESKEKRSEKMKAWHRRRKIEMRLKKCGAI